MSEKAKVGKPSKPRINRYGFLAMWVAAPVLGWLAMMSFGSYFTLPFFDTFSGVFLGLLIGLPSALVQQLSLYLYRERVFRGWLAASVIGWVLGGLGIMLVTDMGANGNNQLDIMIQISSLMLPPTLAQAWILRKHVQQVWLWLLAAIAAVNVFAAVFVQIGVGMNTAYFAFAVYALVTGLTLLWLFGMKDSQNKSKNAADISRLEDGQEAVESAEEDELAQELDRR